MNKNQKAIFYNACFKWIHRKCNGTSLTEYESLVLEDNDIPWQCILCEIADMASKFPFGCLAKMELNDLHDLDLPSQLQLLPSHELRSKPAHIPSLDNFDLDEKNFIQTINSKHVDLPNFAKRYSSSSFDKAFSLFHVNTRSLSKNFDQLQNVLSAAKTKFDLVGTTETNSKLIKILLQMSASAIKFKCWWSCYLCEQ